MKEDKHETLRKLCAFQYWLGSNYNNLPTNSGEMTKRARLYYETIEPAYCECEHPIVANDLPDGKPYCRNCGFNINPDKTKDFCDEDMPIMDYPYDSYSDRINACIDEYRDFIKAQYDELLMEEKADEDSNIKPK